MGDPEKESFLAALRAYATHGAADAGAGAAPAQPESEWSAARQIERLTRPGSKYFNLNPYEVLQVSPDADEDTVKRAYRRLSVLVHPDKNPGQPRAPDAFAAVNEANTVLSSAEGRERAQRMAELARSRLDEELKMRRKRAGGAALPEDSDPAVMQRALNITMCRMYAELAQKKSELADRDAERRRREREEEQKRESEFAAKLDVHRQWEAARDQRVDSWRSFNEKQKKQKKRQDDGNVFALRMATDAKKANTGVAAPPTAPGPTAVPRVRPADATVSATPASGKPAIAPSTGTPSVAAACGRTGTGAAFVPISAATACPAKAAPPPPAANASRRPLI